MTFDGIVLAGEGATPPAPEQRTARRGMQMIFQDPYASLNPRWRVADIVAEPIRAQQPDVPRGGTPARGSRRCWRRSASRRPTAPSIRTSSRAASASASRSRGRCPPSRAFLVCDEPTSALDVSVQAQVLNLMRDLQRELGLTYLFISHNLAVVHHIADRVGVMYLGRIVELAPTRQLFAQPQHPYTRMLLAAVPDLAMTGKPRDRGGRRGAESARSAFRLRIPSALPVRQRALPPRASRCCCAAPVGGEVACHAVEEGGSAPAATTARRPTWIGPLRTGSVGDRL